jgi:hypothetical protein
MKKYSSWEVVKALTENPKLIFEGYIFKNGIKTENKARVTVNENNEIWVLNYNKGCGFMTTDEWTLIQQPIPFIEAVQAYAEGKTVEYESKGYPVETYKNGTPHSRMLNTKGFSPSVGDIKHGVWTVKEE